MGTILLNDRLQSLSPLNALFIQTVRKLCCGQYQGPAISNRSERHTAMK